MKKPRNPIEQVLKTIRAYDMVERGDRVLAAVSGGPDSVFLLHALYRLQKKFGIDSIAACHLDHGLRGEESREDLRFVRRLCAEAGIDFIHKTIHLKKSKRKDISTEELAREERYKFFKAAAARSGANVVATGHTLDDQAETVLMRIIAGTSLKGVVGVLPVRADDGLKVIRPLLGLGKREITRYLDERGIGYRIDRTNAEPIYFRNVVRREIIPFLEKYNPRLKSGLSNLAEHLREDMEFINEARSKFGKGSSRKKGVVEVRLKDLVVQPRALQKEILRDMLAKAGGRVKRLSFRHWKDLERFIGHNRAGSSLDLPGGVRVARTKDALHFSMLRT